MTSHRLKGEWPSTITEMTRKRIVRRAMLRLRILTGGLSRFLSRVSSRCSRVPRWGSWRVRGLLMCRRSGFSTRLACCPTLVSRGCRTWSDRRKRQATEAGGSQWLDKTHNLTWASRAPKSCKPRQTPTKVRRNQSLAPSLSSKKSKISTTRQTNQRSLNIKRDHHPS